MLCRNTKLLLVQGINITGFVMATELFPPKERTIAAVSHEFLWALGGAILPGWAFLFRRWRHLQIIVSIPTILGFVLIWSVSIPTTVGNDYKLIAVNIYRNYPLINH